MGRLQELHDISFFSVSLCKIVTTHHLLIKFQPLEQDAQKQSTSVLQSQDSHEFVALFSYHVTSAFVVLKVEYSSTRKRLLGNKANSEAVTPPVGEITQEKPYSQSIERALQCVYLASLTLNHIKIHQLSIVYVVMSIIIDIYTL